MVVCILKSTRRRPILDQDHWLFFRVEVYRRVMKGLLEISYLRDRKSPMSDVPSPSPSPAAYAAVSPIAPSITRRPSPSL